MIKLNGPRDEKANCGHRTDRQIGWRDVAGRSDGNSRLLNFDLADLSFFEHI